jgi:uncharacterized flavoprotein (TIGR03862 family)
VAAPSPIAVDVAVDVAVVGGGPGGLMVAERCALAGARVVVFDHMASVGRKLLLAGRGGLNLTHSEPLEALLDRYGDARVVLEPAIRAFPPGALRSWCAGLGEPTFVGSSGRVFPKSFRATPLLRAWLRRLDGLGVEMRTRHRWTGWDDDSIHVVGPDGAAVSVPARAVVLALGGASWPRVGSDGSWVALLHAAGVEVRPLRPANSGFDVAWSPAFAERFAGTPVKNVRVSVGDGPERVSVRGEAMITSTGIEGGVVYAVGATARDEIDRAGRAVLTLDLHPDVDVRAVSERLAKRRPKDSASTALRRTLGLAPVAVGLLREHAGTRLPSDPEALARLVTALPLVLTGVAPIGRAISTAGGVALDEVDGTFMLRRRPGTFVVGEMLDWEAPTGGYLLQATFSTAVAAADGVLARLT